MLATVGNNSLQRIYRRLTSLRVRTLAVVCAVCVIPVLFVWLSSPYEDAVGNEIRSSLENSATEVALKIRTQAMDEDFEAAGKQYNVWVRVFDMQGNLLVDTNGIEPPGLRDRFLFAPSDPPTIALFDSTVPAPPERLVYRKSFETGRHARCGYALDAKLLVCEYAQVVESLGANRVVYLISGTPRALSSLYDERFMVTRLTFLVLFFAIALGLWLGWRIGRPLQNLREAVIERTSPTVSTTPIEVEGEDEFAELAEAFNSLLLALEDRRRASESFVADMAHEVKNPVAAIRAAAESLERKELSEERAARISRILTDSAKRLDSVVNRFLALAQAEAGLPRVEREDFDIGHMAETLVESYHQDPRFESLELKADVRKANVNASPEHIETCLRNLIQNAASFAKTRVDVRVTRDDEVCTVQVQDDGPGIAPEDLPRVFDRFFTRRDDGGGTGLGLAMVRAISEAHGGTVRVESKVGEGAMFELVFPRA